MYGIPPRPGGSLYASVFASVIIKLSGCWIFSLDNDLEHLIWNIETRRPMVYTFSVRGFGVGLDFSDSLWHRPMLASLIMLLGSVAGLYASIFLYPGDIIFTMWNFDVLRCYSNIFMTSSTFWRHLDFSLKTLTLISEYW